MALYPKIALNRGRVSQLQEGVGNNQYVRASEYNQIVDRINNFLGENANASGHTATGNTVTINEYTGKITTATLTTAAGATEAITLNNSVITALSTVLVVVENYSGTLFTNGVPVLLKAVPAAGSAVITLGNIHATNALNGTVTLKFIIL